MGLSMADLYSKMAGVAAKLLAPTSAGGLRQGTVILTRTVPGDPDLSTPWIEVASTTTSETLKAAVSGVGQAMIDGETILAGDLKVICAVPAMNWRMGGEDGGVLTLSIDGRAATIIKVQGIPEAGTPAAVRFIVRR